MGVADSVDQLRCNAWLLARRTRRWGRALQHDAEDVADRWSDWGRGRSPFMGRLSRTAPTIATVASWDALKERFGEPVVDWLSEASQTASKQGHSYLQDLREASGDTASMLRQGAKAAAGYVGFKNLFADGEGMIEEGATRLGKAAKKALASSGLTSLSRRDLQRLESRLSKQAAKAGISVATVKSLLGRAEGQLPAKLQGRKESHPVLWGLGFALAGLVTATYVATRMGEKRLKNVTAPEGVQVQRFPTAFGEMAYRVKGQGTPLVLLHPIVPGASGQVWEANLDTLAEHFQVFVIDWLGFGLSDKPDIAYTAERFAGMLTDFLQDVVKQPAVIVAAGHSGAIAARAINQNPDLARQLVLVNPIGTLLGRLQRLTGTIVSLPFLEAASYLAMTRRSRIESMLCDEFFTDPNAVSDDLIEQFYANAHQPGASHAFRDLMAGCIDLDLPEEIERLSVPVAFVWGRNRAVMAVGEADELQRVKPDADVTVFAHSAWMPQCEDLEGFNQLLINRFAGQAKDQSAKRQKT